MTSFVQRILGAISKFFSSSGKQGRVFVISDTHFNHRKIIEYADRSFSSVQHMNKEMVKRWNQTVGKNDTVYFLGDFNWHDRHGYNTGYWITHLNGRKVFIAGNHDHGKNRIHGSSHHKYIPYRGYKFCLIHDPKESTTKDKTVWMIHGHSHNNLPFIDGEKKRINASVEVIDYRPLNLDKLIELDLPTIKRMDTIKSRPIRMVG